MSAPVFTMVERIGAVVRERRIPMSRPQIARVFNREADQGFMGQISRAANYGYLTEIGENSRRHKIYVAGEKSLRETDNAH